MTREHEKRANEMGRRRDDERRKRRQTAPEVHAEMRNARRKTQATLSRKQASRGEVGGATGGVHRCGWRGASGGAVSGSWRRARTRRLGGWEHAPLGLESECDPVHPPI